MPYAFPHPQSEIPMIKASAFVFFFPDTRHLKPLITQSKIYNLKSTIYYPSPAHHSRQVPAPGP